jgi:hypothetical protein
MHASKCIHQWQLNINNGGQEGNTAYMNGNRVKTWLKIIISRLGNSKHLSISNGCGLHTIIVPISLQEWLFLNIFGNTVEREMQLSNVEMKKDCNCILEMFILRMIYKTLRMWECFN